MSSRMTRLVTGIRSQGGSDRDVLDAVLRENSDSGGLLSADECIEIALRHVLPQGSDLELAVRQMVADRVPERWLLLAAEGFASRISPPMDPLHIRRTVENAVTLEKRSKEQKKRERSEMLDSSPRVLAARIRREQVGEGCQA